MTTKTNPNEGTAEGPMSSSELFCDTADLFGIDLEDVSITEIPNIQDSSNPLIVVTNGDKSCSFYYYDSGKYHLAVPPQNKGALFSFNNDVCTFVYPQVSLFSSIDSLSIYDSKNLQITENTFLDLQSGVVFSGILEGNSVFPITLEDQRFIHNEQIFIMNTKANSINIKYKELLLEFILKKKSGYYQLSPSRSLVKRSKGINSRKDIKFSPEVMVDDNGILGYRAITETGISTYIVVETALSSPIPKTHPDISQGKITTNRHPALVVIFPGEAPIELGGSRDVRVCSTTVYGCNIPLLTHTKHKGAWISDRGIMKKPLKLNNEYFFKVISPLGDKLEITQGDDENSAILEYSQLPSPHNSISIPIADISVVDGKLGPKNSCFLDIKESSKDFPYLKGKYVIIKSSEDQPIAYYKITPKGILKVTHSQQTDALDNVASKTLHPNTMDVLQDTSGKVDSTH